MAVSTNTILSRMTSPELQDVQTNLACMLYGGTGVGKTTLAAGLAQALLLTDDSRIGYVDSRENFVSLKNIVDGNGDYPLLRNLDRLQYESYGDLVAVAGAIKKKTSGFENIEVVILDEFSSMADQVLDTILRDRLGTPATDIPTEVPDWTDYRPTMELCRKVIEAFLDAGVHVIITAHAQQKADHRKVLITMPSFSPKLNEKLQQLMHVTGYVSSEIGGTPSAPKYQRFVQSQPTALISAKTRAGGLRSAVKLPFEDFTNAVVDWIDGSMAQDLVDAASEDIVLAVDQLPTEGIPITEAGDDDPVFVDDGE